MTTNNRLKSEIMSISGEYRWRSQWEEMNMYPQMKMYCMSSHDLVLEGGVFLVKHCDVTVPL